MPFKFKKNQRVKFAYNVEFRDTGGPYIPVNTPAVVLKRSRTENIVWVKSDYFGIHKMSNNYLTAA